MKIFYVQIVFRPAKSLSESLDERCNIKLEKLYIHINLLLVSKGVDKVVSLEQRH